MDKPRYSKVDQLQGSLHKVISDVDSLRVNITEAIIYLTKAQDKLDKLLAYSKSNEERDRLVYVKYQITCALEKLRAKE